MLEAYFDASGKESDQPFLVVAGFVSSAVLWIEFEDRWRTRLKRAGITTFHATECEHCEGEFRKFRNRRKERDDLVMDLIRLIRIHVYYKFGCNVVINDLGELSEMNKRKYLFNAYSLAGRACAALVAKWRVEEKQPMQVQYIFEKGDEGMGMVARGLEVDGFRPIPIFRDKKDRIDQDGNLIPGNAGLQAADCLAYESFRELKNIHFKRPKRKSRWQFTLLNQIDGIIGEYGRAELRRFNKQSSHF
ncbi:MAG: DUF3800 domain-containing protein [Terriglobia bacterium]